MNLHRLRLGPLLALFALLPSTAGALPTFGTPHLVADLAPGAASSSIRFILPTPHGAVFLREPQELPVPPELWATDGTEAGTYPLQAAGLELPLDPTVWVTPRFVYFEGVDTGSGNLSIWRTDGTVEGTIELVENRRFRGVARTLGDDGPLVFLAATPTQGIVPEDLQLWVSDGSPEGTHELKDVLLTSFTLVDSPEAFDGAVYYLDGDFASGALGLWRTDGTSAGTELVELPPGAGFWTLWSTDSALYLLAEDQAGGARSLWTSDGTTAGTHEVMSLGDPAGVFPAHLLGSFGDGRSIWTFSTQAIQPSVWVSDGTGAGTRAILDVAADASGNPRTDPFAVPYGGLLYFAADDGAHGREVWRTDGTPEGTEVAIETAPGDASILGFFHGIGDRLYLTLQDPAVGEEPRVSDGTLEGTHLLGDLCPGSCSSAPFSFMDVPGGTAFLARNAADRYQLWGTDLTSAGTAQVTDFPGGIDSEGPQMRVLDDQILFVADDGVHGKELWTVPLAGGSGEPPPPPGPWLTTPEVPGFESKVRITPQSGAPVAGAAEPACIPETLCVSGALPGRSEVFVRVVGPKGNGYLWPTLVKFSTSQVEVWIRQIATGVTRYYVLAGARPGFDELPGLFDRKGFEP